METAPTLSDVARKAGVSTATVSRCLNAPDKVISDTRERVLRVVNELGYTPNFGGRALAMQRTHTVGAVIPTMDNSIFATGLQAFQQELSNVGITLLVGCSNYNSSDELEQIKALVGRGADGLMLIGQERPNATYEFLEKRNIPYVLAWTFRKGSEKCYVGFDNFNAAKQLADYVLQFGHRNVAMIAGITAGNDRAADRLNGVKHSLNSAGLDDLKVVESAYTLADAEQAFSELWQATPKPTAVICGNDVLAVGAIARAQEIGLRVPEDISIVGFDDIDLASIVSPKLTTVHVPHRRMGKRAAEILIEMINNRTVAASYEIPFEITDRESLGYPNNQ